MNVELAAFDLATLVRQVALVFATLALLAALDLTLGGEVRRLRRRRRTAAIEAAYGALVAALGRPDADRFDRSVEELRAAPPRLVDEALTIATRSIGGADGDRLRSVAAAVGVPRRAHEQLRSRRWSQRLRAVRILRVTAWEAPPPEIIRDPVAEVRAAAALWAGRAHTEGRPPAASLDGRRAAIELVDALADALLDRSALVRLAAKHAVATAQPPITVAIERALRRAHEPELRDGPAAVAPLAVVARSGRNVDPELVAIHLAHVDGRVRAAAIRALAGDVAGADPRAVRRVRRRHGRRADGRRRDRAPRPRHGPPPRPVGIGR